MTFSFLSAVPQLALVCGLGVGAGLWLILHSLRPASAADTGHDGRNQGVGARLRAVLGSRRPGREAIDGGGGWRDDPSLRLLAACGVGVLVGLYTRWPVAALLSAAAMWSLPGLLGSDAGTRARVARVEAIAAWTEMLRDTLSAAAGLEQAITATAPAAPAAIREHVHRLADRLSTGQRLPEALRAFGDDLDDPTADLVIAALLLASEHQARQVGDLLSSLAITAREQVTMRQRVDAGRARTRTSVRVIIGVTLAMAAGLVLLNRPYLAPYDTPFGQLVLAGVGALFVLSLWWLARIAAVREPARVLTGLHALTNAPNAAAHGPASGSANGLPDSSLNRSGNPAQTIGQAGATPGPIPGPIPGGMPAQGPGSGYQQGPGWRPW